MPCRSTLAPPAGSEKLAVAWSGALTARAEWVNIRSDGRLGGHRHNRRSDAALYFGNSLRRKTRAEVEANVAEKRFSAYAALWAKTKNASPMRSAPLTAAERSLLYDGLTDWYYEGGNGMLLTEQTRNIYLLAKRNLTCANTDLVPELLVEQVARGGDAVRGQASIDQLSLLRTSMRADLWIFTEPYDQALSDEDISFLTASKVDLHDDPWRDAISRKSNWRDAFRRGRSRHATTSG